MFTKLKMLVSKNNNNTANKGKLDVKLKAILQKARQGDAKAQCKLGNRYYYGNGIKVDRKEALKWWEQAADQGNGEANYQLSVVLKVGLSGVAKDKEKASIYEEKARTAGFFTITQKQAEQGESNAQYYLARMYAHGCGVEKDESQAVSWYRQAAEQGNACAQNNLGWMYQEGCGVEKDDSQAVSWYRKAAEQGYALAQYNLGLMYEEGRGVEKDDSQAVSWCRQAAEQGYAPAQNNLGLMYEEGCGVEKDESQAVSWYRQAAEQGEASAQVNLGLMYDEGCGVEKDEGQAVSWYRQAAEQGNASAQYGLGWMYANGRGVEKDEGQAVSWYRQAAEQGEASAQFNLGWMYAKGRGVEKDDSQAVSWYRQAAEQGNAGAQVHLGLMYKHGRGVEKDDSQAVSWYRQAAEQGEASAQVNLGLMYDEGRGVEKDDSQAVSWYRQAAEQGEASAQVNLGLMYDEGRGVEKDDSQAVSWYRQAAEQGEASAQYNLGLMYEDGQGVEKDESQAVSWYRQAAEQGNAGAQVHLGLMYKHGRGVEKDDSQAVSWYRQAAEQGEASAQNNLGLMYAKGRGVEKDEGQAVSWYRKAAEQGNALAQYNLGVMYKYGKGVKKHEGISVYWFLEAAKQGDPDAIAALKERGVPIPALKDTKKTISPVVSDVPSTQPVLRKSLAQSQANLNESEEKKATDENKTINTLSENPILKQFVPTKISFQGILLPAKDLIWGKILGQGSYGKVSQGTWLNTTPVAIKDLILTQWTAVDRESFEAEATLMYRLRHPNIVQLYGVCQQEFRYSLVMELMPKGTLYELLHNNQPLSWERRWVLAGDIAQGINYLHTQDVLHRDLKSLNVLISDTGRAKLTDFGLSKVKQTTKSLTSKSSNQSSQAVGTLPWMAPELFKRKAEYTKKADIYSLGMILWELSSRKVPFSEAENMAILALWKAQGEAETIPDNCPKPMAKLIKYCWFNTPEKRPTAAEMVKAIQQSLSASNVVSAEENQSGNGPLQSGPQFVGNLGSGMN
jgi:TPR repeat protein